MHVFPPLGLLTGVRPTLLRFLAKPTSCSINFSLQQLTIV